MDKSDGFLNRWLWVRVPSGVPHGSRLTVGPQALNLKAKDRHLPPVPYQPGAFTSAICSRTSCALQHGEVRLVIGRVVVAHMARV
jgi:hypothetical protein